jgi:cytochrome c-type biogenesis protein CcmF
MLVMVASAIHLYNILTHQFQYSYVWSYSSRELSTPLLISTFYAGQEGSFLLWALFTALIAIFLMRYTQRMGYEPQVMGVYGLIQLSLLLMLLVKSPFSFVWESWPDQVEAGFVPANGRGLNPLLQNYWMVIHPQVLFSGFAAMGVPYAFAVAAMMRRDYAHWIRPATPWLVYGAMVLGLGIMMGGFWAYETLGWGGYWGWDPVENSSLVPWLFSVATIHTMLSQRKSGAFVRTNLALSMLCFVFVLYSTFLTRSGVLGETSVHSFVDPGMWAYWLLIGVLSLFTVFGFGLLIKRMKEMPKMPARHELMSREFALSLGSAVLVTCAILITIGTSSPIITNILQGRITTVDISYYSTTILPLGILIGILSGIAQLLWWTRSNKGELLKSILFPALLAGAATVALILYGLDSVQVGLFVFGAAFSLFANLEVGRRIVRGNPKYAGGAIAHVGLGIMFLGFVSSSVYDEKQTVSLREGTPTEVMGYQLTYTGYSPVEHEKFAFHVDVEKDGMRSEVSPIMYVSSYTNGLMRNPDIINLVTKDFYVAPLSLEQPEHEHPPASQSVSLKKGETKETPWFSVTFLDFDFPVMERAAMLEGRKVNIGAALEIKEKGQPARELISYRVMEEGKMSDQPARYGDRFEIKIAGMKPDRENKENSTVELLITDLKEQVSKADEEKGDILIVEASVKPYINLVWNGVILLLVGFLVTIIRRSQEARLGNRAAS